MRTITLLLMAVLAAGCVTQSAKDELLLPSIRMSWELIEGEVLGGISMGLQGGVIDQPQHDALVADVEAFSTNLVRDSPAGLSVQWLALEPWAQRHIEERLEAGTLGSRVALSLQENLEQFGAALARYER